MGNLEVELYEAGEVHDEATLAGDFFCGDIPMSWFQRAIGQSGCTFRVAILVWHYWKLRKGIPVKVSMCKCGAINVSRVARNAALDRLAELGLIEVLTHRDRAPVVKVIT